MHTRAGYVWCAINGHDSWGHQSSSEWSIHFSSSSCYSVFSCRFSSFFSPPFPPKIPLPQAWLTTATQGLSQSQFPPLCPAAGHNLILCHHRSLAHGSPKPTTYKYSHPEGNAKPQTACAAAQRERKREAPAPLAPAQSLLWPLGELGQHGTPAESFLPPPKEKQLTERVCLNSTEKLNVNKEEQDLSLDVHCYRQR